MSTEDSPLAGDAAAVIGGGIGGLSAACYLADGGADVTLYEQRDQVGGVAGRLEQSGFRFDTGPSWYLMPDVFERFFAHFDRDPSDYYQLERLDPHYRVFWKDGDRADVSDDLDAVRSLFESYEPGGAAALDDYLQTAAESYEIGMDRFVYEDRPRLRDFLDLDVVRSARGLTFLGTMQDHVEEYVDHPKLQQLLQYTLVFLGGAPTNTPALYNLMSHVDLQLGVYYPEGGMYSVVEGLAQLATEAGAEIETGAEVTGIAGQPGRMRLDFQQRPETTTDIAVANATPYHVERELIPDRHQQYDAEYWQDRTYAPGAFLLYLGVEGDVDPLAHHTLVLPTDWSGHFESIFEDPAWPTDPSYYVNVPSRTDDTVAPEGHETVVILVPIAAGLHDGPAVRSRYREKVLRDLADHTGVDLRDRIVVEEMACISEFAEQFHQPRGTALGLAHTLWQTGPLRPSHRAGLDGLYYTGSYTTPGIGVPMAVISGEHTYDAVRADRVGDGQPRLPL
ncbi:MAG: phytoene desaturase family protein [Halobacteriaceae archaeon]